MPGFRFRCPIFVVQLLSVCRISCIQIIPMKNFTNDDILKMAVFLPVLVPIYLAYACFKALKALLEFQD
jgi:hypothetical protein